MAFLKLKTGEVQFSDTKLNLICPYTMERIKVPVRGQHCPHYMCVCLQTLIMIHKKTRLWKCPICSERINEPVVDMYISSILNDRPTGSEVFIMGNGKWKWIDCPQETAEGEGEIEVEVEEKMKVAKEEEEQDILEVHDTLEYKPMESSKEEEDLPEEDVNNEVATINLPPSRVEKKELRASAPLPVQEEPLQPNQVVTQP